MSRSKAKPVFQPDDFSCGPVALKTALSILRVKSSVKELKTICKTNSRGTSIPNLIRGANRKGVYVMAIEWATLKHLQSALKYAAGQPRAVIVDYLYKDATPHEETGHYATVSGFSSRSSRIILLDSYTGTKKSYRWTDFLDRWYDYDYQRVKAEHSIRRYQLYKRWRNLLMLVLARDPKHLPKFRNSTKKIYLP